jgi:hypothetical protein
MKKGLLVSSVVVCVLLGGCAKAPDQAVAAAKTGLQAAQTAEAAQYAAIEYAAVVDSLNAALAEIEKQNSAFPLVRNYTKAQAMLTAVTALTATVQQKVIAEKEKIKVEAETAIARLSTAIADAKALVPAAPRGKNAKAAAEAVSAGITLVEASAQEAAAAAASGDFEDAGEKASAALIKINTIIEALNTANVKTTK